MTVGTFTQPDHLTQDGSTYKLAIKNSTMVMSRLAAAFAPHEQNTPNMTVRVDAGYLWVDGVLTEIAAQNSATITVPGTNPRIDRVVKDIATAAISVVTGTEAASPSAPDIPEDKEPICQIYLETTTTAIDNTMITDERVTPSPSVSAEDAWPVGAVFQATVATDPATLLGFGTWESADYLFPNPAQPCLLLHFNGSGAAFTDSSPVGRTVTGYGSATQSSAKTKFGNKSLYIPGGTGDYIIPAFAYDFLLIRDFTLDFWVNFNPVSPCYLFAHYDPYNPWHGTCLYFNGSQLQLYIDGGNRLSGSFSPSIDTWYHIAICRSGGSYNVFINGSKCGSTAYYPDAIAYAGNLYIGAYGNGGYNVNGYMAEFRIVDGFGQWIGDFTPPVSAYANIYSWKRVA